MTDRRTELLYQYRESALTRDKTQQLITRLYAALKHAAKPRHDAALPRARKAAALPCGPRQGLARKAASLRAALPRHTDAGTYVPRLI